MREPDSEVLGSNPWSQLVTTLADDWPVGRWSGVGVVVGVSGGADSVALLRALDQLRRSHDNAAGFIIAAHFHHGVRGDEADQDADFVQSLAAELGVRHQQGWGDGSATDESTMRDARAAFLRQTAQRSGARYVAVAHSADDNVETVLHHLLRGTGPKGLAGIPPSRPVGPDPLGQDLVLIRPLLGVRRELIRSALREIGQPWCEDSSNQDSKYRRNWIRGELLPLIQTKYPSAEDAIVRMIKAQNDWKRIIDELAADWIDQHVTCAAAITIQFSQADRAIVVAALQVIWAQQGWPLGEMTQEHWLRLAQVIHSSQRQRFSLPGDIDVQVDRFVELQHADDKS